MNKYLELMQKISEVIKREEISFDQHKIIAEVERKHKTKLELAISVLNKNIHKKNQELDLLVCYQKNKKKYKILYIVLGILSSLGISFISNGSVVYNPAYVTIVEYIINIIGSILLGSCFAYSRYSNRVGDMQVIAETQTVDSLKEEIKEMQIQIAEKNKSLDNCVNMLNYYTVEAEKFPSAIKGLKTYLGELNNRLILAMDLQKEKVADINRVFAEDRQTQDIVKRVREKC